MVDQKTPRHIYDEAIEQAFRRVPQSKWPALLKITEKAKEELDVAEEEIRANSFELGRSAGYETGYEHGYKDGHTDRLTAEQWEADPRSDKIKLEELTE